MGDTSDEDGKERNREMVLESGRVLDDNELLSNTYCLR